MLLPSPPTDVEKTSYIHQRRRSYYLNAVLSFIPLALGGLLFSFLKPEFRFYLFYLVPFIFYISLSYFIGIKGKKFNLFQHVKTKTQFMEYYPTVDIYIPTCGEPISVIQNTLFHASEIRYPGELQIYVLDDKRDPQVEAWAKIFHLHYLSRPNQGEGKKAGNLLYAFKKTKGDLILVLDADFAPRKDILTEMVPHMVHNEQIGIVQSPQFFDVDDHTNWLQRGAAAIQILFYKLVQVSRDSFNAPICVGSCALYRRLALLSTGFYQINYSEDVHTGFMVLDRGYRVKYLPIPLAKGLCPDDIKSFFSQQIRWATGSLALCTNLKFWRSSLTLMQKLCFSSGFLYYIVSGLGVLFIPMASLMMIYLAPEHIFWWNVLCYLPSFVFGFVFLPFWMGLSPKYSLEMMQTRQISYWAHLFAMASKIIGRPMQWVPTGSKMKPDGRFHLFIALFGAFSILHYLLVLAGLVENWDLIRSVDKLPHLIFSSLYFYCNFKILCELPKIDT